jgi:acyl-CoA reductase-like NAD-dependent aldehyde dehydrogenase
MTTPNSTIDWHVRARGLNLQTRPFIGGRFDDGPADHAFDCVSPIDGKRIASLAEVGARGVDAAVTAARKAFESGVWANMAPRARKKVLLKLAALVDQHREELALLDTLCMGMPISISKDYCVPWAINALEWYGEAIDKLYDEVAPTDRSVLALITREPVGVVGAVLPWNWPMGLLGWKVPPALAAGNSVVLKPDEQTSLSALRFAGLAQEAGLPDGVLNVVTGGPAVGEAIGRHPDIDVVGFTGSTEVGKLFMKYSAESNMKPVWTECGGKGPNIVFADAPDLAVAAQTAAFMIFLNTGQVCAAASRLIIEESAREQVLEIIKGVGQALAPADPLERRPCSARSPRRRSSSGCSATSRLDGRKAHGWLRAAAGRGSRAAGSSSSLRSSTACATTCASRRKRSSGPCSRRSPSARPKKQSRSRTRATTVSPARSGRRT